MRFIKTEAYDLGDLTREEMNMIERGLDLVVSETLSGRGPWDCADVAKLRDEVANVVEGGAQ